MLKIAKGKTLQGRVICHRCCGLMVLERTVRAKEPWLSMLRCVNCGEIIDPLILENRASMESFNAPRDRFADLVSRSAPYWASLKGASFMEKDLNFGEMPRAQS